MHRTILRLLAVLIAVALVAAACGDSGEGNGESSAPAQAQPTTTATPATTATTATTATPADTGQTTLTFGTLPEELPGIDDECLAVANVFTSMGSIGLALTGQSDLDADGARALFDEAKDRLPRALHGDVDTLGEAIIAFFQAMAELGIDFTDPQAMANVSPAEFEALNEAAEFIDAPAVQQAVDNLSNYAEEQCADLERFTP